MSIENQTAVVFIDLINDFRFSGGEKLRFQTKKIVANVIKLKQYAMANRIPIIYVNDHYGKWKANQEEIIAYCRHPDNDDLLTDIRPNKGDYFLTKPRTSGFYQTALSSLLRELKVHHIFLAGIAGNICVLFTANDAHMRDFSISVPKNCVASNDEHVNDLALQLMKDNLSANIDPI